MKTWAWMLAAVVGGYLVYSGWFGGSTSEELPDEPPELEIPGEPEPAEPEAGASSASPLPPRKLDLDVEASAPAAPPRDEKAWALDAKRREALAAGDAAKAKAVAREILADHAASDPARWVLLERGLEELRRYRQVGKNKQGYTHAREAWRLMTPALFLNEAEPADRAKLRATLGELAEDLLFGRRHVDGVDVVYVPKPGDSLSVLCRRVFPRLGAKLAPGFVVDVNHLGSARNLRAREPVRVPKGESEIVVVKSRYRLYFLHNGCYVRDFRVGLGREGSTPVAEFVVSEKIKNPDWNPRAGVTIPYGHPKNILGTRWMAFRDTAEYRGFGIHGTKDPSSIGKDASSGCIRMSKADVEKLFEWTPRGTRVRIQ